MCASSIKTNSYSPRAEKGTSTQYVSSSSKGTGTGDDVLRNKLSNRLRDEYGRVGVDDEMKCYAVDLLTKSRMTKAQMESMDKRQFLINRCKRTFRRSSEKICNSISPVCEDEFQDGYDVDHIVLNIGIPDPTEFNIRGPAGSVPGLFKADGSVVYGYTEDLKRYLGCYLRKHDFRSVTLFRENQENLTHLGKGASVVVVDRANQDLLQALPVLRKSGVTVIAISQKFSRGLVYNDEECYYCDPRGYVRGYNRHRGEFGDISDPFPEIGMYKGYMCFTLVRHGTQRIVVFVPGETDIDEKYNPETTDFYYQTPEVTIPRPDMHKNNIGTFTWRAEQPRSGEVWTYDPNIGIRTSVKPNRWQRVCEFLHKPLAYTSELLTLGTTVASLALTTLTPVGVAGAIGAPLLYTGYRYVCGKLNEKVITLALCPVVFKCSDDHLQKELETFYLHNPIDSMGLGYGFYIINSYSIVQVPEGYPGINYTNMPEFYQRFGSSKHKSDTAWIGIMNASMETCGMKMDKAEGYLNCFTEMHDVIPTIISSKVPFKINVVDDKGVLRICLSGKDELKEYLMTQYKPETVAAIMSRRGVRGGVECLVDVEQLLEEYKKAWCESTNVRWFLDHDKPDYDKYKGKNAKKWKKYDAAYQHSGDWWTDSIYRLFIKLETLAKAVIEKKGGRIISPNSPEFNLLVMNFCKAFEEELYSWVDKRDGLRIFAKECNYDQRDLLIREVIIKGRWKYCIPIDCKNFDGHIAGRLALVELLFFKMIGMDPLHVEKLIHSRITGVASYDYLTRKSGDMFTGCGNCMLMYMLLYPFFDRIRIVCDGDDTLLFMNDKSVFDEIKKHFLDRGVELGPSECVEIVRYPGLEYSIPFCQMRYTAEQYDLDHNRMLNKLCNIAVTNNVDAMALKIIGKLQASYVLKNLGYTFDVSPMPFFDDFPMSWWQEQKGKFSAGSENLYRQNKHLIEFKSSTAGLVGKIVLGLNDLREEFSRIGRASNRQKFVLKHVKRILREQLKIETELDPRVKTYLDSMKSKVDLEGVRALLPYYHVMLREAIAKFYNVPLKQYPYLEIKLDDPEDLKKVGKELTTCKFANLGRRRGLGDKPKIEETLEEKLIRYSDEKIRAQLKEAMNTQLTDPSEADDEKDSDEEASMQCPSDTSEEKEDSTNAKTEEEYTPQSPKLDQSPVFRPGSPVDSEGDETRSQFNWSFQAYPVRLFYQFKQKPTAPASNRWVLEEEVRRCTSPDPYGDPMDIDVPDKSILYDHIEHRRNAMWVDEPEPSDPMDVD